MTTTDQPRCPRCGPCIVYTSVFGPRFCNHCGYHFPPAPPQEQEEQETAALVREALAHMPRVVVP